MRPAWRRQMRMALKDQADMWTNSTDTALAMVGTLFLPLTFLAGVFGMNFVDQVAEASRSHALARFTAYCRRCFEVASALLAQAL